MSYYYLSLHTRHEVDFRAWGYSSSLSSCSCNYDINTFLGDRLIASRAEASLNTKRWSSNILSHDLFVQKPSQQIHVRKEVNSKSLLLKTVQRPDLDSRTVNEIYAKLFVLKHWILLVPYIVSLIINCWYEHVSSIWREKSYICTKFFLVNHY